MSYIAIQGDRIIDLEEKTDLKKHQGLSPIRIDTNSTFITPGFIDSHLHMMTGRRSLLCEGPRNTKNNMEFQIVSKNLQKE